MRHEMLSTNAFSSTRLIQFLVVRLHHGRLKVPCQDTEMAALLSNLGVLALVLQHMSGLATRLCGRGRPHSGMYSIHHPDIRDTRGGSAGIYSPVQAPRSSGLLYKTVDECLQHFGHIPFFVHVYTLELILKALLQLL